nr:helix-turn-helix transcriptional regulator [Photorhabdus sp. CRCIA-P01]
METTTLWFIPMNFPARLIQLRKAADLTQQALADSASLHVNQIRRYEAGSAQPTLDALIRLAKVLYVSLDELVFDDHERGPSDDLALQFEAVSSMPEEERRIIKALLDGMILKYQAKQITERG